jgi:hypothetical protein
MQITLPMNKLTIIKFYTYGSWVFFNLALYLFYAVFEKKLTNGFGKLSNYFVGRNCALVFLKNKIP